MTHNILSVLWVSSAVALVFFVMHYWVAAWLASMTTTAPLGKAFATFFPGT